MIRIIIELVIAMIPTGYGGYLLYSAYKIKGYESEEDKEATNKKINRMRRSGNMFFLVGLYLMYQFYKMNLAS